MSLFVRQLFQQVSSVAAHDAAVSTGAMAQILLWVSAFECISTVAVVQMLEGSGRAPGDFGFDPYQLNKPGKEAKKVHVMFYLLDGSLLLAFALVNEVFTVVHE